MQATDSRPISEGATPKSGPIQTPVDSPSTTPLASRFPPPPDHISGQPSSDSLSLATIRAGSPSPFGTTASGQAPTLQHQPIPPAIASNSSSPAAPPWAPNSAAPLVFLPHLGLNQPPSRNTPPPSISPSGTTHLSQPAAAQQTVPGSHNAAEQIPSGALPPLYTEDGRVLSLAQTPGPGPPSLPSAAQSPFSDPSPPGGSIQAPLQAARSPVPTFSNHPPQQSLSGPPAVPALMSPIYAAVPPPWQPNPGPQFGMPSIQPPDQRSHGDSGSEASGPSVHSSQGIASPPGTPAPELSLGNVFASNGVTPTSTAPPMSSRSPNAALPAATPQVLPPAPAGGQPAGPISTPPAQSAAISPASEPSSGYRTGQTPMPRDIPAPVGAVFLQSSGAITPSPTQGAPQGSVANVFPGEGRTFTQPDRFA